MPIGSFNKYVINFQLREYVLMPVHLIRNQSQALMMKKKKCKRKERRKGRRKKKHRLRNEQNLSNLENLRQVIKQSDQGYQPQM